MERSGPYATVYLDASHDTEDASHANELRWAQARSDLSGEGADEDTLRALDIAVAEGDPAVGRAGRVLVAAQGEVLLDEQLPRPPARQIASWQRLPDLVPMVLERPEPVAAVAVRIDETGGEILVAEPDGRDVEAEAVEGGARPVHKVRGGGWSHLRMQERVEESWRRNTAAVAERVDAHVAAVGARVLVLAGDPPSRSRLRDALGEAAVAIAVDVDHSAGADHADLVAAIEEAVSDVVSDDRRSAWDRYATASGRPDGLAVEGLAAVAAAFRAEAVDTVLLDGDVTRDATLWVSDVPTQVATSEQDLVVGDRPPSTAPADAALLRAAVASGAGLVPFDGPPGGRSLSDGVGALLRYPLPARA